MKTFLLSEAADQDLRAVADWTVAEWGTAQRDRYFEALFAVLAKVLVLLSAGRVVPTFGDGIRKVLHPSRRHAIYYRISAEGVVEVLRGLHTARDQRQAWTER